VLVSAGGLLGWWSVEGPAAERVAVFAASGLTLLLLLANGLHIRRAVLAQAVWPWQRVVANLGLLSLLLCTAGDLVNFNLPQTFHRHGGVVRHDYLADSVWCFAPGYLALLAAVLVVARQRGLPVRTMGLVIGAACVSGLLSFAGMHLPGTGAAVTGLTGVYSMVITAVGGRRRSW
jgi:hypothetical protein